MHISLRQTIAALTLATAAVSGPALASTFADGSAGPGYGDAFLAVQDGNNSVVEYLGFNFTQGVANNIPTTSTINLGVVMPSSATWQFVANKDAQGFGLVTTGLASQIEGSGSALGTGLQGAGNINTAANYMQQYIANGYNPNCTSSVCTANNAQAAFWADVTLGGTGVDFSGSVQPSTVLNVYELLTNSAQTTFSETKLGTATFTEVGSSTTYTLTYTPTAVPVPAALWLLGSGLAGLGFVGRRRKEIVA